MTKSSGRSVLAAAAGILVVTGIAAVAGMGAAQLFQSEKQAQSATTPPTPRVNGSTLGLPAGVVTMPIPPVLTNLAGDGRVWVRTEFVVLLLGRVQSDALAAEIANDTVAYLRTVTPSQLSSPNGLVYVREDIEERVRVRTTGSSQGILFKTFIVE